MNVYKKMLERPELMNLLDIDPKDMRRKARIETCKIILWFILGVGVIVGFYVSTL